MAQPRRAGRAIYDRLGRFLSGEGSLVVHERLFGSGRARQAVLAGRAEALARLGMMPDWPVTYVEGGPPWGHGLAGVLIRAIRPGEDVNAVWTVADGPSPVGWGWRRLGGTFLTLQAVSGLSALGCRHRPVPWTRQTARMIARADGILHAQGLSWANVARTWFHLSDIAAWHEQFDQARRDQYARLGVPPNTRPLPASTAVGAESHLRGAGVLDVLAVAGSARVRAIRGPRPVGAHGVVVEEADVNVIEVSATSSADAGDARTQIDATLERIESVIRPEHATLKDVCSGTAFVKRPEDAATFRRALLARRLEPMPVVCVVAAMRRPEMLFEMDAQVAVARGR